MIPRTFAARLSMTLLVLLTAYSAYLAFISRKVFVAQEQEALQQLSHGLASHMVEHWPQMTTDDVELSQQREREAVLSMLMVVNPGVQAYVLDENAVVKAYIGDSSMVRQHQVDMAAIQAFLSGHNLPIYGTDPMRSDQKRIFSVAKFSPRTIASQAPGYLYIVLDGSARSTVALQLGSSRLWQGGVLAAMGGLLIILFVGLFTFRRLTQPLQNFAAQLESYELSTPTPAVKIDHVVVDKNFTISSQNDEVSAIRHAFESMKQRLAAQTERERKQSKAHREIMAGLAHDLRTPLTALHGHLEVLLNQEVDANQVQRKDVLATALSQSDKVRKLTQQLFELAMLQSTDELMHKEPLRLDELVSDTVQKFSGLNAAPRVVLAGLAPGALTINGDLQLIERALTNLIDNAQRHAGGAKPVRVSVTSENGKAQIIIEDEGPGLPPDVAHRLLNNQSLRESPIRRATGGLGGLGLAIAQRVAWLHGGTLKPMPNQAAQSSGTQLCLVLPLMA